MVGFLVAVRPFDHVVVSALHLLFGLWLQAPVGYADLGVNLGLCTAGNLWATHPSDPDAHRAGEGCPGRVSVWHSRWCPAGLSRGARRASWRWDCRSRSGLENGGDEEGLVVSLFELLLFKIQTELLTITSASKSRAGVAAMTSDWPACGSASWSSVVVTTRTGSTSLPWHQRSDDRRPRAVSSVGPARLAHRARHVAPPAGRRRGPGATVRAVLGVRRTTKL